MDKQEESQNVIEQSEVSLQDISLLVHMGGSQLSTLCLELDILPVEAMWLTAAGYFFVQDLYSVTSEALRAEIERAKGPDFTLSERLLSHIVSRVALIKQAAHSDSDSENFFPLGIACPDVGENMSLQVMGNSFFTGDGVTSENPDIGLVCTGDEQFDALCAPPVSPIDSDAEDPYIIDFEGDEFLRSP